MFKIFIAFYYFLFIYINIYNYSWFLISFSYTLHNQYFLFFLDNIFYFFKNNIFFFFLTNNTIKTYLFNFNEVLFSFKIIVLHTFLFFSLLFFFKKFTFFFKINLTFILIICVLLTLGIIWSGQEVLWSGMWDWNFLELGILIVTVLILLVTHFTFFKKFKLIFFWNTALIYILYTKYILIENVHSFVNLQYLYFSNIYIYIYFFLKTFFVLFYYLWLILSFNSDICLFNVIFNKIFFLTILIYFLKQFYCLNFYELFFLPNCFFFIFLKKKVFLKKTYLFFFHKLFFNFFIFFIFFIKNYTFIPIGYNYFLVFNLEIISLNNFTFFNHYSSFFKPKLKYFFKNLIFSSS